MKPITVLSLFDGISCGRVALQRANIPVEKYLASEIDKYAIQVTQKNWPDTIQIGDVTKIDFTQFIGKIDLLIGGSPCQDLSIAGKREGLSGERSGLFFKFVEALNTIKPKWFLLENNVGMPQEAYEKISELMGCYPVEINSALVSAQTRKRFYWTNIGPKEFNLFGFPNCAIPHPEDKGILLKDVLETSAIAPDDKSRCILSSIGRTTEREYFKKKQGQMVAEPICVNSQSGRADGKAKQPSSADRIYSINGKCVALLSGWKPNIAEPIGAAMRNRGEGKKPELNYTEKANALTSVQTDSMVCEPLQIGHISNTNAQANRVYSVHNKSVTLKANGGGGGAKTGLYKIDLPDGKYIIRKLTPLECERLQTLPDNYTEGISNSQRYKCIGNGWTVDVIAYIFSFLTRGE